MAAPPIRRFQTRTSRILLIGLFVATLLVSPFPGLGAQGRAVAPAGTQQATPATAATEGSKVLNLEDYGRWNRTTTPPISPDLTRPQGIAQVF